MVFCAATSAALAIIQSFSTSYLMFVILELLSSTVSSGIYTVTFILGTYVNCQKLKFQNNLTDKYMTIYTLYKNITLYTYKMSFNFVTYYNILNQSECELKLFLPLIIAMELFLPHQRVLYYSILECFLPIGSILVAYTASFVKDWRLLLQLANIPGLLFLSYFWLLT